MVHIRDLSTALAQDRDAPTVLLTYLRMPLLPIIALATNATVAGILPGLPFSSIEGAETSTHHQIAFSKINVTSRPAALSL